jgi:hypothetical protein
VQAVPEATVSPPSEVRAAVKGKVRGEVGCCFRGCGMRAEKKWGV